jgi:hypothetical protein
MIKLIMQRKEDVRINIKENVDIYLHQFQGSLNHEQNYDDRNVQFGQFLDTQIWAQLLQMWV